MDPLISLFIDNEMDLNDQISFVDKISLDKEFKARTIDFLEQEKIIRSDVVDQVPEIDKVKIFHKRAAATEKSGFLSDWLFDSLNIFSNTLEPPSGQKASKFLIFQYIRNIFSLKDGLRPKKSFTAQKWRPMTSLVSALALTFIILFFIVPSKIETQIPYRFIIFMPEAKHAEITGTFTKWQNYPMKKAGDMGYWEIILEIPKGEHRFTYIIDGTKKFPDPTLPAREGDDFGGENSILSI